MQVGFGEFTIGTASNILAAAARRRVARPEDEYIALKGILGLTQTIGRLSETERQRKRLETAELLGRGDISGLLHSNNRHGGYGCVYHKIGTHLIDGVVPVNHHFKLSMSMGGVGALVAEGQLVHVHDWRRTTGNAPEDADGALLVALGSLVVPAFGGPQLEAGAGAWWPSWSFSSRTGHLFTIMGTCSHRWQIWK